jgi:Clp amino terminal domain, pathogenicity island component
VFERFTDRARHVVVCAQDEARSLRHNHIGTEHILLGLLREREGVAARVLISAGVTLERTRAEVLKVVGAADEVSGGQIPFTGEAKKVLELSLREALSLGANDIGTEHILLGLVRASEGLAARLLRDFDADSDRIRTEVLALLSPTARPEVSEQASVAFGARVKPTGAAPVWARVSPEIRALLGREADAGDLLLMLASMPDSLVARTLAELGIGDEALDAALERARAGGSSPLEERLELLRSQRAEAEAEGDSYTAAHLRAEELRARREHSEQLLERVRARLGLAGESEPRPHGDAPP